MTEWIAGFTSLPNLHPAVVHFPIVLVTLATFLDLAAALGEKARPWLARAGALVWVLAGLGAGAAYWAGLQAEESVEAGLAADVSSHLHTHEDWGLYTVWAVGLLAAARLLAAWWKAEHRGVLALGAILGLGATAMVWHTADLGGGLVYHHEVAVGSGEHQHDHGGGSAEPGDGDGHDDAATGETAEGEHTHGASHDGEPSRGESEDDGHAHDGSGEDEATGGDHPHPEGGHDGGGDGGEGGGGS